MNADDAALIDAGFVRVAVEAREGGAIEGVLVIQPMDDHLFLQNIAVQPARRGSGLGRVLMRHAEREALEHSLPEIRLYTNILMTANLTWRPRLGFTETGRHMDNGFDSVHFRKVVMA